MNVKIRPAAASDTEVCGRIIYDAFKGIADRHRFPPAFPSLEAATRVASLFIELPSIFGLVAEHDGGVVGAVFLDEGDAIRGVALIAVDPNLQARGIGRHLMLATLDRARGAPGVRLVQEAYNSLAMALYASLGFEVKEPLVLIKGNPRSATVAGVELRPFRRADLAECAALCRRVHGFERTVDLEDALKLFSPFALVRGGRITAYTYRVFAGHLAWGVAENEEEMKALILGLGAAIPEPLAFLMPIRQASFFRWCLNEGFRVEKPLTLMAIGEYQEPSGCYFPSGIY